MTDVHVIEFCKFEYCICSILSFHIIQFKVLFYLQWQRLADKPQQGRNALRLRQSLFKDIVLYLL